MLGVVGGYFRWDMASGRGLDDIQGEMLSRQCHEAETWR